MNNKTILVTLVLIVVAALIFFNFERFTGQATKVVKTKLYVSSEADVMNEYNPVIAKGKYVYFTQIPGEEGGSGTIYIREMEGDRKWGRIVRTQKFEGCNERICREGHEGTLNFKTYYDWEGEYCGEVTDFATWKKVIACFTVK